MVEFFGNRPMMASCLTASSPVLARGVPSFRRFFLVFFADEIDDLLVLERFGRNDAVSAFFFPQAEITVSTWRNHQNNCITVDFNDFFERRQTAAHSGIETSKPSAFLPRKRKLLPRPFSPNQPL